MPELPEILIAPQNQTIKIGKSFVLECDADGNPQPIITWLFNELPLTGTQDERIKLENENTELIVAAAQETDSGKLNFAPFDTGKVHLYEGGSIGSVYW